VFARRPRIAAQQEPFPAAEHRARRRDAEIFRAAEGSAGEAPSPEAMMATSAKRGARSKIAAAKSIALAASTAASAGMSPSAARAGHQKALARSSAGASSVCDRSTSVRDKAP
jgi:hypothetical protein